MRRALLSTVALAWFYGSSYSAAPPIPVDIFQFNVHGNGATEVLGLLERYAELANLSCQRDRIVVLGTQSWHMSMPGVDCEVPAGGMYLLRADLIDVKPSHVVIYTYNPNRDPRVKATISKVIAAVEAAAKSNPNVDDIARTCCVTSNQHPHISMP